VFIGGVGGNNPDVDDELTTYPADMDRELYTLFRPAELEEGKKYPVLTWGNGTCSHPLLFTELIEHVASHGFIVIATNSRQTAGGVEMLHGIDFVLSENANSNSILYGKVDTAMLGAFGHSQGSGATLSAGADPRIVATVPIQGASAAAVRALHGPTFLIAGELDTLVAPSGVETAFAAATLPAVYGLSIGQDHLMPGLAPSPILDAVTAWFRIHLADDAEARELFYGDACKLCSDPRWQIQRKNL
jgi:predicted dienelactone hydrolase